MLHSFYHIYTISTSCSSQYLASTLSAQYLQPLQSIYPGCGCPEAGVQEAEEQEKVEQEKEVSSSSRRAPLASFRLSYILTGEGSCRDPGDYISQPRSPPVTLQLSPFLLLFPTSRLELQTKVHTKDRNHRKGPPFTFKKLCKSIHPF